MVCEQGEYPRLCLPIANLRSPHDDSHEHDGDSHEDSPKGTKHGLDALSLPPTGRFHDQNTGDDILECLNESDAW